MSDAIWFYVRAAQQYGPMSLEAIQAAALQGQLTPMDMVWRAGMTNWMPAHLVPEVMSAAPLQGDGPPSLPTSAAPLGYYAPPSPGKDIGQNAGIRMLMPVGRSTWAMVAGYLGLFSLAIAPAPFAVFVSIMAIRDIRRHPDRHGMGRAIFGLVMGSIMIMLVIAAFIVDR
jgi:GYF domain 2/Domain of unknown function (DUF4190)